jgi:hypothetical protein
MDRIYNLISGNISSIFMIIAGLGFCLYIGKSWTYVTKVKPMKPFYLYSSIAIAICSIYLGVSILVREYHIVLP